MDKIFGEVAVKYKLTAADFPKQEDYVAFFEKSQVHLSDMPKLSDFEKEAKKVCSPCSSPGASIVGGLSPVPTQVGTCCAKQWICWFTVYHLGQQTISLWCQCILPC